MKETLSHSGFRVASVTCRVTPRLRSLKRVVVVWRIRDDEIVTGIRICLPEPCQTGIGGLKMTSPWRKAEISGSFLSRRRVNVDALNIPPSILLMSERRWAIIKATVPVPVPMSRTWRSSWKTSVAAPRSTPSVFTFMAERSLRTSKRLKWNTLIFEYIRSAYYSSTNSPSRMKSDRSHILARSGSWVTMTTVCP